MVLFHIMKINNIQKAIIFFGLAAILSTDIFADANADLFAAADKGDVAAVQKALKAGANVNTRGLINMTPLIIATMNKHTEVVRVLLKRRPNLDLKGDNGGTALYWAQQTRSEEIVKLLKAAGAKRLE